MCKIGLGAYFFAKTSIKQWFLMPRLEKPKENRCFWEAPALGNPEFGAPGPSQEPGPKGQGPLAQALGWALAPQIQDFPALRHPKNSDFPEVFQALASKTIVFRRILQKSSSWERQKCVLTAYSIKSEIFGTLSRSRGNAATDPGPEPPSSRAGGQDDGS